MNVRNSKEHILKKIPFLKAFQSEDDESFEWLIKAFISMNGKRKLWEDPGLR